MSHQINKNEWRRSFTTVFLALLALLALSFLVIGSYHNDANRVVNLGLLAITISSSLLMVFLLIEDPEKLDVFIGSLAFKFGLQVCKKNKDYQVHTLEGEHKSIHPWTGFLPPYLRIEKLRAEEERISVTLGELIRQGGLTSENCERGLELLEEHKPIVQKSWTHLLNKSRLLAATGNLPEAEELAYYVIANFSHSNEACGIAYEVLSFIEEFKEPKEQDELYWQWLEKIHELVMKGLSFHPEGHDLLMNGFEIATREGNAKEVLSYVKRAVAVDKARTQANLAVNPLAEKAMELSPKVKKTLQALTGGDSKMKIFKMLRAQAMILVLLVTATLSWLAIGALSSQIKELTANLVSIPTSPAVLLAKARPLSYVARLDGTSFGNTIIACAKTGTSFGNQ